MRLRPALFLLACLFVLGACGRGDGHLKSTKQFVHFLPVTIKDSKTKFLNQYNTLETQKLNASIYYFQELVEWALTLRAKTHHASLVLAEHKEKDIPFTAAQLEAVKKGMQEHLALRESMHEVVSSYASFLEADADPAPWLSSTMKVKGALLSLAAALMLYDNFAFSILHFQKNDDLRKLSNAADKGYGLNEDQLYEVFREFTSPSNRKRVRKAQKILKDNQKLLDEMIEQDRLVAWLNEVVKQSPSSANIRGGSSFGDYARLAGLYSTATLDRLKVAGAKSMNSSSKFFGNTVGLVQTRKGLMYGKKKIISLIQSKLKPLDILLEKTPFRLTDKLIPGHFGHVAIYVGSEKDLKSAGLWEHPLVKPHQEDISKGATVLEALRDGVQLNTLEHFMNVDDFCALRPKATNDKETKETLIRSFRQLGKEYDFNFDVETTDRIVCSELAYIVYTHIHWPTEKMIGRSTISPDNVANKAVKGEDLSLLMFYHDGEDLKDNAFVIFKNKLKVN